MNFATPLARLRLIGLVEGVSCVLLFFVAMPLKYLADQDWAVKVVGSLHGGLWVLYMLAVANAWSARKWPLGRAALAAAVSIPPIATFLFDRSLRREQHRERAKAVESPVRDSMHPPPLPAGDRSSRAQHEAGEGL